MAVARSGPLRHAASYVFPHALLFSGSRIQVFPKIRQFYTRQQRPCQSTQHYGSPRQKRLVRKSKRIRRIEADDTGSLDGILVSRNKPAGDSGGQATDWYHISQRCRPRRSGDGSHPMGRQILGNGFAAHPGIYFRDPQGSLGKYQTRQHHSNKKCYQRKYLSSYRRSKGIPGIHGCQTRGMECLCRHHPARDRCLSSPQGQPR